MLDRFVQWLDDLLAEEGAAAVVRAVLGLMSFAMLLAAVFGNAAVKAGAFVVTTLVVLSLGLVLLSRQRVLKRRVEENVALVAKYSKMVADDRHPSYQVIKWEEHLVVEANGDARKSLTIRAKVVNDLQVLRLVEGCRWPQPARYRSRVRVDVRKLLVGDLPGASLSTTKAWVEDGKLVLIVHFPRPPRLGSEINIAIGFEWPGRCEPLVRNRVPEDFVMRFQTPVVYASYKVVLPRGTDAYVEPVGFDENENGFFAGPSAEENGRPVFLFDGFDLPERRTIGMRLELKGRGVTV
ncbi:hypothetical protein [Saccharothrix syringae]|uniref:Uncharacterized protein n=1 Tax=Saccharothrix syringae TaxID=103733 RepID=A0A5Q0GUB0_SACSY|nr:hypothetical protein [Saccharothrix syringae]QFZ17676.1 hypothetical protein EKG83_09430 [Saccharothrix syringae]